MSTGGIFKILSNTGGQDKLLFASELLSNRIKEITDRNTRILAGATATQEEFDTALAQTSSWLPTITEIEQTHVMFVNNSFKPMVTMGFEYNKVSAKSASAAAFGSKLVFTLPQFGDFVNDCVLHLTLKDLKSVDSRDRVRYISFLGHRLLKLTQFIINGNPIDEYTTDEYNAYYQFKVPSHKRIGWMRNVGQEIPSIGHLTQDSGFDMHREYKSFGSGAQTLKQKHDTVDLWIPLLFWFKELRNSVPSLALPYGQTNIEITLAEASEIIGFANYGGGGAYVEPTISNCYLYVNNIFMSTEVRDIFMKKFGFSLMRAHLRSYTTALAPSQNIHLQKLKWPIETMFVGFRPRENLNLSQHWNKYAHLNKKEIKVPVVARNPSAVFVGNIISSTSNTSRLSGALSATDGDYIGYDFVITGGYGYNDADITQNRHIVLNYVGATQTITIASWKNGQPNATTTYELFTPQLAITSTIIYEESPVIDTLELNAHGVVLFKEVEESFYNSYLPYRYGSMINTPSDRGWYMINLNLMPGDAQPSGHINVSKVREFYLRYTSKLISSTNQTDVIVLADALNFLLVIDGTSVLRYST
jgi:hypothetical protein